MCVHKYRDWKIYTQANGFQKPSNGKILHKADGYVKSLSPIEMTPKIQCQSKGKPHLIIWKILRNPQGEQRCTTSTLGGNSAAGKGTGHSHLGNFVTPHNLSAAQRAKPTCGSQPQMPRWERESSVWHLSPTARDTPCFLPQLCMLFLDGAKEEANWAKSEGTGMNLMPGLT